MIMKKAITHGVVENSEWKAIYLKFSNHAKGHFVI